MVLIIHCVPRAVYISKVFQWLIGTFQCFFNQSLSGRWPLRRHCCGAPFDLGMVLRHTEVDGGSVEVLWRYLHDVGSLGIIDLKNH